MHTQTQCKQKTCLDSRVYSIRNGIDEQLFLKNNFRTWEGAFQRLCSVSYHILNSFQNFQHFVTIFFHASIEYRKQNLLLRS